MTLETVTTDVLIVGAGPTGLMLANWLAKLKLDAVVIDPKDGPTRESRALVVQARTMEVYDQLGVIGTVLRASWSAWSIAPGYEKRQFGSVPIGDLGAGLTPYSRLFVLEQSRNEEILADNLRTLGSEVLWNNSLDSVDTDDRDDEHPVVANVTTATGPITIRAKYCVGADGSNSAVRRLRGIPFEGSTYEHVLYVCDATGVRGLRDESINMRPGRYDFLLTFPMGPNGHHRLLGILRAPGAADTAGLAEETVRDRLERIFGVTWADTAWFSTYRVHHRVAATFRQGPFFLAGDAGHVHSPVGAQGMNTGLQDAHNLAMKLADVLHGRASDVSLDRYEAERRPVAKRLVGTTDRLFVAATSDRWSLRMLRKWIVPVVAPMAVGVVPRLSGASRLFAYVSQIRIHYWMSDEEKVRSRGRRDPVVGRRLPWAGGNFEALKAATWQIHVYGGIAPDVAARVGVDLGTPVHEFPPAPSTRLRAGVFYLVRPDGFVAATATAADAAATFRRALPDRYFADPPQPL